MRRREKDIESTKEIIMDFIILHIQINGYAPSFDDIAGAIKCSKSEVGKYIDALENDGRLIVGRDGKRRMPRAIKVNGYVYMRED